MKKTGFLSFFLAAALLLPVLQAPIRAENETTPSGSAVTQPTQEPIATLPPPVVPLDGDASVSGGCHSLDAKVPLTTNLEYTPKAKAALLYEMNTDTLLYAFNPDERLYPASLTKVMTCLVALDLIEDLDEIVTVPQSLVDRVDASGSGMDLVGGEEISMRDLLYGLMVESANDAAMTIAEHLCGSEDGFVGKMNQKAMELGCQNTNFMNVHGLHDEQHYTCARDMAKILREAEKNPVFQELYSTRSYTVPATNKSEERKMVTTNYMMSEAVYKSYIDHRVIGGKTGFTTPAGRCLVTVSESGNMKLLSVVLGTQMEYAEDGWTVLRYGSFEETHELLDFGYGNFTAANLLSDAQTLGQFEVIDGDSTAHGMVRGASASVLPVDSNLDTVRYEYLLDDGTLKAPIQKGEPIGVVRVWYHTKCLAQQELFAAESVRKAVPVADLPSVEPANPVQIGLDPWQWVLIAILVLLAAIFLMLLGGKIRMAMRRAKRRKRVAAKRKAIQRSSRSGNSRSRAPDESRRRR